MIKRIAFYRVKESMDQFRIPILVGLRRTGKTTILKQLNNEINNSTIIRFDSLEMRSLKTIDILEKIKFMISSGTTTFLLDEIQVRDDWDVLIKELFDDFVSEKKIKVVVTGSSSLAFENKDTGVDRTEKILITTLDFNEYLNMTKKENSKEVFEDFLGKGAFPEYTNQKISQARLKELILEPIINGDIPAQYKISPNNVVRLLFELSTLTNGEFNKNKSSKKTGISINQINNYLDILEKTQIIKRVYQVDEKGNLGRYPFFKIYINPHFHLWLLNKNFKNIDNSFKGHIIESYWLFASTQINGYYKRFYYLKNKMKEEIDFVSLNPEGNPIFKTLHEFKYNNEGKTNHLFNKTIALNKVIWYTGKSKIYQNIHYENIFDYKK